MAETPSGMLNAVGLQNKGVDYFVEHIYPRIKGHTNEYDCKRFGFRYRGLCENGRNY